MTFDISIIGAGNGEQIIASGRRAGMLSLAKGQVEGLYHAPVDTEWASARQQRGGSFKGLENPTRDMELGFHVLADRDNSFEYLESQLRSMFTYHLDPWWPDDELARICVQSDRDYRELHVQMYEEPEVTTDTDPSLLMYGNVFYKLRAAQPFWESPDEVTAWETSGTSGSGTIEVSNPTDIPMYQRWVLTPGTWTVPDVKWTGRPRHRTVELNRTIALKPVTSAMGTLVIDLDPMRVMMADQAGTNVMGDVGGGYYFMFEIPPHTPKTQLPISVTAAPAGGARAELHQPRLWSNCYGGY